MTPESAPQTHSSQEIKERTDELIKKFYDGERKYRESALFNVVIHMLAKGADPLHIIANLIQNAEEKTKLMQEYITNHPPISIMSRNNKEEFEA